MRGTRSNIVFKTKDGVPMVIPVKIANYQKADTSLFKQACPNCKGDVGRKNVCKECEQEIEFSEILKGVRIGDDNHVFTKEQIEKLKDFDNVITVLGTIQKTSIDQRLISGAFAVLPDSKQKKKQLEIFQKAWKVIESGLAEGNKAILVKFSTRAKEKLGILTSQDSVITLLQIVYDNNRNELDETPTIELSKEEKIAGLQMLDKLTEIDPTTIEDDFRNKVERLVETGETIEIIVSEGKEEQSVSDMFKNL